MQKENKNVVVVSCPPCGENALEGQKGVLTRAVVGQALPDNAPAKGHLAAFTLIELLVVVLIIGILAAVAVPQYQKAVYKSRYATLKNLAKSIAVAQEVYYLANGQYAEKFEELDLDMPGGKTNESTDNVYMYDWGTCSIKPKQTMCFNSTIQMTYQQRYNVHHEGAQSRVCISHVTEQNSIQNQICKMETGQSNKTGGSIAEGYFGYHYLN